MQQKVVLKLDIQDDENCKQKAMKLVSVIPGLDSISMDMEQKKMTVVGEVDPVAVMSELRKSYNTEIVAVEPVKEPQKPKDDHKKA